MENIVKVSDLSFAYGRERVLDSINLKINKGDFIGVIGANGAGKSTLVKLLLGILPLQTGNIFLMGEDIKTFKSWDRIGYVPQGAAGKASFPATVLEIVMAGLYSQIGLFKFALTRHKEKAMSALESVGMEKYANRLIGSLSGGQRQRVCIARALAADAELILLDEPMAGVDPRSADTIYELLESLNKERALSMIMITHDVERASRFTNRVLCICDGTALEIGEAELKEELSHRHKHPHRKGGDPVA